MAKVIGVRKLDFTGGDGKPVKGTQFFLTEPMDAPAEGLSSMKLFVPPDRLEEADFIPSVGDEVEPRFNQYGKCVGFDLLG